MVSIGGVVMGFLVDRSNNSTIYELFSPRNHPPSLTYVLCAWGGGCYWVQQGNITRRYQAAMIRELCPLNYAPLSSLSALQRAFRKYIILYSSLLLLLLLPANQTCATPSQASSMNNGQVAGNTSLCSSRRLYCRCW